MCCADSKRQASCVVGDCCLDDECSNCNVCASNSCTNYECCDDDDCPTRYTCESNVCVPPTENATCGTISRTEIDAFIRQWRQDPENAPITSETAFQTLDFTGYTSNEHTWEHVVSQSRSNQAVQFG